MSWFTDWLRRLGAAAGFINAQDTRPNKPQPVPITTEKDLGWDDQEEPTRPDVPTKRGQA